MIFIWLGKLIAYLGLALGIALVAFGFHFANLDGGQELARQYFNASSGQMIDKGLMYGIACVVIGLLSVIADRLGTS